MSERERDRVRETGSHLSTSAILIAASSFLRERERERETVTSQQSVQHVRNRLVKLWILLNVLIL